MEGKTAARLDTPDPGALEAELHNISDWDSYDALKVRELSHGRPLELTALSLIIKLQLDTRLKLDLNKLRTFLASIEAQYPSDNPYHNAMHAADVVQGVGCIITADEFGQKLTDLEVLALILSAVVHDVAHPGVNNIFLVRAETEAALHYNDNSVNENTHLVKAFSTLRENNFLEGLNDEDRKFLRRLIIEMVLGTDMAFHNAMLKDFANRMTLAGVDIETWENEGRAALLKFVLHAADISNPARPWTVCRFWAQQITTENFLQGERERQAGLTVSPMCDKEKAVPIKSQQIFCELFVKPTFQTLSAIAPNISAKALGHCATNSTRYQAYADKGMMQIPVE